MTNSLFVGALRNRILRGLQAGTLRHGDRLSSARELAAEYQLDYRQVLTAFKSLEAEGLLQVRKRGGAYVRSEQLADGLPMIQPRWLVDVLAEALTRELSPSVFAEWLTRSVQTVQLQAILVSTSEATLAGLGAEIEADFGIAVHAMEASSFVEHARGSSVRRADWLMATTEIANTVEARASELSKPFVAIDCHSTGTETDWRGLLKQPLWVVVASHSLGDLLRQSLSGIEGTENLHIVVIGHDRLETIPEGAPTYVTSRLRDEVIRSSCKGRILPAARVIKEASARRILTLMVETNLRAAQAVFSTGVVGTRERLR